jgi:hypothetical protein
MTLIQVEKRVKALEKTMRQLVRSSAPFRSSAKVKKNWYRTQAGRFAGDTDFDEIVKLGRAYRKSP